MKGQQKVSCLNDIHEILVFFCNFSNVSMDFEEYFANNEYMLENASAEAGFNEHTQLAGSIPGRERDLQEAREADTNVLDGLSY